MAVLLLLLAPAAARAADPIRQFHLAADATVQTKLKVRAGKVYPMVISGTYRYSDSRFQNHFESTDTFYCFQGSANSSCPKGQVPAASIYPETGPDDILPMSSSVDGGQIPAYSSDHTYSFGYKPKKSGTLVLSTQPKCGGSSCTGEGFDIQIFAPEADAPDPCAAPRRAHVAAVNEVRVAAVQPSVLVHRAGTSPDCLIEATKDMVLQQGDEISCDPDGKITLQFVDNSTTVVSDTTQLKIASYFTEGGVVKTEILLRMGQIAAKVHKSEATKSDFRIKSPTGTASVRGTDFSVFYDPGSRAMTTTVREGVVEVDPAKAGLKTVSLTPGQEVEVTPSAVSKVAAPGKAGARNGVSRLTALTRVLKIVARANGPCRVSTPPLNAFAVKPVSGGWGVAIKLTGKHKGTARWTVKGRHTKATNALAKRVAKRCS